MCPLRAGHYDGGTEEEQHRTSLCVATCFPVSSEICFKARAIRHLLHTGSGKGKSHLSECETDIMTRGERQNGTDGTLQTMRCGVTVVP